MFVRELDDTGCGWNPFCADRLKEKRKGFPKALQRRLLCRAATRAARKFGAVGGERSGLLIVLEDDADLHGSETKLPQATRDDKRRGPPGRRCH